MPGCHGQQQLFGSRQAAWCDARVTRGSPPTTREELQTTRGGISKRGIMKHAHKCISDRVDKKAVIAVIWSCSLALFQYNNPRKSGRRFVSSRGHSATYEVDGGRRSKQQATQVRQSVVANAGNTQNGGVESSFDSR